MDSVYNSPPNWPTPPAGWTPPPDWTPDPSWPEPPPGWQFQVPSPYQPPAKKKGWLWLVIGLPVTAVVLIIVLGIAGAITAAVNMGDTMKPAETAASSYVQALKDQRYDAAFAMQCPANRGNHDTFVKHWSDLSATGHGIKAFKIVGVHIQNVNGVSTGQANLELTYADGFKGSQQLPLTKTGSTWNPCP
jgi:hypothetical protein